MNSIQRMVVLPSYNERENIVQLITSILSQHPSYGVCVVDDSSPDGTSDHIRSAISQNSGWTERVHLIVRSKKDGRGGAVREGLRWAWEAFPDINCFIEMDCDFSHHPDYLNRGIELLQQSHDVVLGSRYPNGKIEGWPIQRHILSFFANALTRSLISWKVHDYTNGFRFYSRDAVQLMLRLPQKHKGYIYLSETLSMFIREKLRIGSFPIHFKNRERGVSNTNFSEVSSAFSAIFSIAWSHHFGDRGSRS